MKARHLIPPAIALIGSAAWIYSQDSPLRNLEEANTAIRERLAKVDGLREKSAGSDPRNSPGGSKTGDEKYLLPDGSFSWEAIAEVSKMDQSKMGLLILLSCFRHERVFLKVLQCFNGPD